MRRGTPTVVLGSFVALAFSGCMDDAAPNGRGDARSDGTGGPARDGGGADPANDGGTRDGGPGGDATDGPAGPEGAPDGRSDQQPADQAGPLDSIPPGSLPPGAFDFIVEDPAATTLTAPIGFGAM